MNHSAGEIIFVLQGKKDYDYLLFVSNKINNFPISGSSRTVFHYVKLASSNQIKLIFLKNILSNKKIDKYKC